jgi:tripeptide aminopeptidase
MNRQRLLDRFLRYVRIDTAAREGAESYPSSPGQLELGRLLVEELLALGLADARQDAHGIVTATVPATVAGARPTIALCAHLDTSPETPGAGVRPQLIERYPGGDIVLPGDPARVLRESDHPELAACRGHTLVTSDGTTLLGADDKSGVAVIVEAAAWLVEHPEIAHGPVRLVFTCDEEIGRGVDRLDLGTIGAAVCYTLDGQGAGTIDVETSSADAALVSVEGVNIHPSIAKGRMTNAVRAAADFLGRLPRDRLAPEATDGREGFVHPYEVSGGVGRVTLKIILRDFDTMRLADRAAMLRAAAAETMRVFPGAKIDVAIRKQYRNMAEALAREPRAVGHAEEALRRLGRELKRTVVRGGTDGSRLSEMGLPTPNLATGQHNPHSLLEWASLDEMAAAAESVVKLAEVWGEEGE